LFLLIISVDLFFLLIFLILVAYCLPSPFLHIFPWLIQSSWIFSWFFLYIFPDFSSIFYSIFLFSPKYFSSIVSWKKNLFHKGIDVFIKSLSGKRKKRKRNKEQKKQKDEKKENIRWENGKQCVFVNFFSFNFVQKYTLYCTKL